MTPFSTPLNQAHSSVVWTRSVLELCSKVCQTAVESGRFNLAWIGLLENGSAALQTVAKAGDDSGVVSNEFVRHCGCARSVIRSAQPAILHKVPAGGCSPRGCAYLDRLGLGTCAAFPIGCNQLVWGVLAVSRAGTGVHSADTALIEQLAQLISLALERGAAQQQLWETRQALNTAELQLKTQQENALDGFYLVDMQGNLLQVNDAYCQISGYSREELLHMRVADLESVESAQDIACHIQKVVRQGADRFESAHRRKDGVIIEIESTAKFDDFAGGRGHCFIRDITERKQAEQALRTSEERFRRVVEGAPVGVYIQTEGRFLYLNPAALAMLGAQSPHQLVGQSFLDRVHPDSRSAVEQRVCFVRDEHRAVPFREERYLGLDGTALDVEVGAIPFSFEGRDGALVFLRDISERKREENKSRALEQQLRQAQKMEAVGQLAGGIAHDFNNLLMVIQSYTEMLQEALSMNDPLRAKTEAIMKASDRAVSLTRQLLAFSRKQTLCPVVLDLNVLIDEAAQMLRRLIGEDIEFQVRLGESLWAIEADPDQIVQVLMNLCVNARDAMPLGGTLRIASANVTVAEANAGGRPYVPPGDYVCLSVSDTGVGIPEEVQEQIFDPFFTTKKVGQGTGLGLASVYGVVEQSGGHIGLDSTVGQGTCFKIYLHKVEGAAVAKPMGICETRPRPYGRECVLIAEDEDALREAICDYLRALEYTVLPASSGQQALSIARDYKGKIDLLITDLVMPRMSGQELSQMLAALQSGVKTIYMSGYAYEATLRHGMDNQRATFLQKPFSLGALARKVRETLASVNA